MSSSQPSYEYQWADPPPGLSCVSYAEGSGVARVTGLAAGAEEYD